LINLNNDSKLVPSVLLLTGAVIAALSGLFIKVLPLSTTALLGFRFGIPFLVMLPYMIKKKNYLGRKQDRIVLWSGGFLNLLRMAFYIIAFKLTAIGNAIVLLYLWPVFALIITFARYRKMPDIKNMLVILTAFLGVVVMNLHREFSMESSDLFGSLSMIASAFIFSAAVLLFKKALFGYSEGEVVYFQNSLGALVFIPFLVIEAGKYQTGDLLLGALYGLLIGVVCFLLLFFALKRVSVFHYSILTYMEIPFAIVVGLLFLGESLAVNQIVGMVIVVISSFTAQRLKG
jgi:drug/metabolite transporter (DMT)-like permease